MLSHKTYLIVDIYQPTSWNIRNEQFVEQFVVLFVCQSALAIVYQKTTWIISIFWCET